MFLMSCSGSGFANVMSFRLTQPGMALLEECFLHEVSSTLDSLLSEERLYSGFSLRPGKCNPRRDLALHCECDFICMRVCRGATHSKLLKLVLNIWRSQWKSPLQFNVFSRVLYKLQSFCLALTEVLWELSPWSFSCRNTITRIATCLRDVGIWR